MIKKSVPHVVGPLPVHVKGCLDPLRQSLLRGEVNKLTENYPDWLVILLLHYYYYPPLSQTYIPRTSLVPWLLARSLNSILRLELVKLIAQTIMLNAKEKRW